MMARQLKSRSTPANASHERSERQRLRPVPKAAAAPWLVFPHGKGRKSQSFYNPCEPDERNCIKSVPEMRGRACYHKTSHQGWLIVIGGVKDINDQYAVANSNLDDCFLWNPLSQETIQLPKLDRRSFTTKRKSKDYFLFDLVLSSPPPPSTSNAEHEDDDCTVFLLFRGMDARGEVCTVEHILAFCRPGDNQWRAKELYASSENKDAWPGYIESLLCFKGKLYAFGVDNWIAEIEIKKLWHNAVIDNQTQCIRTFKVKGKDVDLPILGAGEEYNRSMEHWLESGDEIFRVYFNCSPRGYRNVTSIHILKLDFSSMAWVLLNTLDDHVLFLCTNMDSCKKDVYFVRCYSTSSACCSAADMGLEKGCLFYTLPEDQTLYMFEIEDSATTVILPSLKLPTPWFQPTWIMMPTTANSSVAAGTRRRNSTSLPALNRIPASSTTNAYLSPWLISIFDSGKETICDFIDPMHNNDKYFIKASDPLLEGATIRFSKHGWLVLSGGKKTVFLYNPFTRATIRLPDLPNGYTLGGISFSSAPTSADCVVIAVSNWFPILDYSRISFLVTELGKSATCWTTRMFRYESMHSYRQEFMPCINNPVFYKGDFYCLDYNGMLGVLSVKGDFSWEVASKSLKRFNGIYPSFLVECDGKLLLVNIGQSGKSLEIYRLDDSKMVWVQIKTLGKYSVFVSYRSSFSVVAPQSCMENRIYLPRLYGSGEQILYYSLDTCRYHCVGSNQQHSLQDFHDTKERSNCTWIEPNSLVSGES